MDLKDIKRLIDMFDKSDLNELSIDEKGTKVCLKKGLEQANSNLAVPSQQVAHSEPVNKAEEPNDPKKKNKKYPEGESYTNVVSPMVGTFYRSPAVGAEPFVQEGDKVKKGQVLCIVEAMKLMNEIVAETHGTVVKCLPENAQPVEFGEVLFVIETFDHV